MQLSQVLGWILHGDAPLHGTPDMLQVIEMTIAVFQSVAAPSAAERMLHDGGGERCHLAECNLLFLRRRDPM